MATRIDIELTSRQDEGKTFTWRAAGARQPKGAAEASLFPEGASVGDEFKVETEMDVDGIRVTSVIPAKGKEPKKVETLELIARDDEPLVTQVLAEKGRGRGGDRGDRRGPRREGARRRDRKEGDRGPRARGRRRAADRAARVRVGLAARARRRGGNDRPRTPAKPKLPPKPKAAAPAGGQDPPQRDDRHRSPTSRRPSPRSCCAAGCRPCAPGSRSRTSSARSRARTPSTRVPS